MVIEKAVVEMVNETQKPWDICGCVNWLEGLSLLHLF